MRAQQTDRVKNTSVGEVSILSWFAGSIFFVATLWGTPASAEEDSRVPSCEIVFTSTSSDPIGVLEVKIDYSEIQGTFGGSLESAECDRLSETIALIAIDTCDGDYSACQWGEDRTLRLIVSSTSGIGGTVDVARCRFYAIEPIDPDAFHVEVQSAGAPATMESMQHPTISVLSENCAPVAP